MVEPCAGKPSGKKPVTGVEPGSRCTRHNSPSARAHQTHTYATRSPGRRTSHRAAVPQALTRTRDRHNNGTPQPLRTSPTLARPARHTQQPHRTPPIPRAKPWRGGPAPGPTLRRQRKGCQQRREVSRHEGMQYRPVRQCGSPTHRRRNPGHRTGGEGGCRPLASEGDAEK